jgi:hypothetical protein
MLQTNTNVGAGVFAMLAACCLAIGFLVRFLIALVTDRTSTQARVAETVHSSAEATSRGYTAAVDQGPHVALGVFRLTTALSSNVCREETRRSRRRVPFVAFALDRRFEDTDFDAAIRRPYRLS